jgi:thiamine pyrophosphokinase
VDRLRGAYYARPAIPDPDHAGGGIISFQKILPSPEDVFFSARQESLMARVVIFANGEIPNPEGARGLLQEGDYLLAADGGANHLFQMGILPNLVVGDLDSIDEDVFHELTAAEVEIVQYPENKDETDLELAIRTSIEIGATSILIVGALGGRLDQSLASLSLLSDPMLARFQIRLDDGEQAAFFCRASAMKREEVEILGRSGDTVSLIPWGGIVEGVTTKGLQWALYSETLYPEKTRGISNVLVDETASVEIASGLLLLVHRRQP